MASCRHCGAPLPEGAKFCLSCGKPVEKPRGGKPKKPKKKDASESEAERIAKESLAEIKEGTSWKPSPKKLRKPEAKGRIKKLGKHDIRDIVRESLEEYSERKAELKEAESRPADFTEGRKMGKLKVEGKRPREEKKPPSPFSMIGIPILIGAIIVVFLVVLYYLGQPPQPAACVESWSCGEWSDCVGGAQTRSCFDANECGTTEGKPATQRACTPPVAENKTPEPECLKFGEYCEADEECCAGFCVHHRCVNGSTYCGDGYCDEGEDCVSCPHDCGECPTHRDLEQNVFTEPLDSPKEQELKGGGYVIVRYFYSDDCPGCFTPAHIENQLRELAADSRDLFAALIIDTQEHPLEASKHAKVGTIVYKPLIKVEGLDGHDALYGEGLEAKLSDGDIMADVSQLVCAHSEYCVFEDGVMTRTYS